MSDQTNANTLELLKLESTMFIAVGKLCGTFNLTPKALLDFLENSAGEYADTVVDIMIELGAPTEETYKYVHEEMQLQEKLNLYFNPDEHIHVDEEGVCATDNFSEAPEVPLSPSDNFSEDEENPYTECIWTLDEFNPYAKKNASISISGDGDHSVYVCSMDLEFWKEDSNLEDSDLVVLFGTMPADGAFVAVDSSGDVSLGSDLNHACVLAQNYTGIVIPTTLIDELRKVIA